MMLIFFNFFLTYKSGGFCGDFDVFYCFNCY